MLCLFVPFEFDFPRPGLDPSWIYGVNQAVSQKLAFGSEFIFTYGPYASILTTAFHPDTYLMMWAASAYLGISAAICIVVILIGTSWARAIFFWLLFVGSIESRDATLLSYRDALLLSYPLLVGLCAYCITTKEKFRLKTRTYLILFVVFGALGVLPLAKGTLFLICLAVMVLSSGFFLLHKNWPLAFLSIVAPLILMILFWLLASQSLSSLYPYFANLIQIILGYSEAMSNHDGPIQQIIYFLVAASIGLIFISLQKSIALKDKLYLLGILICYLFISFKGGFVRHDMHAVIAGSAILYLGILLICLFNNKTSLLVCLVCIIGWALINSSYVSVKPIHVYHRFGHIHELAWKNLTRHFFQFEKLFLEYENKKQILRLKAKLPLISGSADIYSVGQADLIASGNIWSPRPILQGYSVYTEKLAKINRDHLLGSNAPDTIFFNVDPIDQRLPPLEDGNSWPVLLTRYLPDGKAGPYLILKKLKIPTTDAEVKYADAIEGALDQRFELPKIDAPLFLRLDVEPTLLGRLSNFLIKSTELRITLFMEDGSEKQFLFLPTMAKIGFMISPLVESANDFEGLYGLKQSSNSYSKGHKVVAIKITGSVNPNLWWKTAYKASFGKYE